MSDRLGRVLGTVVWFAILVAIALGAAGIVTGMDHPPGSAGRADVTTAGDAEVAGRLEKVESDMGELISRVEALGQQARIALAALNGTDPTETDAAIAAGDELVLDIVTRTASIRADLASVPYVGSPAAGLAISEAVGDRHAALVDALDATKGLDVDWARLTAGSVAATQMSRYLVEHDRLMNEAVINGRLARYDAAIPLIDEAASRLASAHDLRNSLVATVDVSVLDEWLDRNGDYDVALKALYTAVKEADGKSTNETKAAIAAEAAARARLPPDPRGLVIIMADIGQAGMNGAVTGIEEARTELTDALEASQAAASDAPGATTSP